MFTFATRFKNKKIIKHSNIYDNEENISTIEQEEKEQTRFPLKNGNPQWTQSIGIPPGARKRKTYGIRRAEFKEIIYIWL